MQIVTETTWLIGDTLQNRLIQPKSDHGIVLTRFCFVEESVMWFPGWVWFKGLRSERPRPADDRADMGVEIGLDASLDSMLPPLLGFAAAKTPAPSVSVGVMPLGTDLRSRPG